MSVGEDGILSGCLLHVLGMVTLLLTIPFLRVIVIQAVVFFGFVTQRIEVFLKGFVIWDLIDFISLRLLFFAIIFNIVIVSASH